MTVLFGLKGVGAERLLVALCRLLPCVMHNLLLFTVAVLDQQVEMSPL